MVESHANSIDDYLIEGLSFKLSPRASYVTNRRSVSFYPSGSDIYSSASGVKVIKIKINGTDWLDPSTVKVMFTIYNTSSTCFPNARLHFLWTARPFQIPNRETSRPTYWWGLWGRSSPRENMFKLWYCYPNSGRILMSWTCLYANHVLAIGDDINLTKAQN